MATIEKHTPEIHFRGDLRFLRGAPPDRPADGIKDCRIYEAVLAVARSAVDQSRSKFLVTKDKDFDFPQLHEELLTFGFVIRSDIGKLYSELRPAPAAASPTF